MSCVHRCSKCKSANVQEAIGCWACGSSNIKRGIKIRPKDLRDYFASEVAARVNDPNVVMRLLRHTSLATTTKYLRTVKDRMQEAVLGLGFVVANSGSQFGSQRIRKNTQNDICSKDGQLPVSGDCSVGIEENFGGGGQTRTVDSADMSHDDSDESC